MRKSWTQHIHVKRIDIEEKRRIFAIMREKSIRLKRYYNLVVKPISANNGSA
ncbi:MAG: hypothetical protein JTT13_01875 [Candidatus Brockarchaeota archaeon]|nr:hypothetical protein [Candidatus Brockarchaeota archaeon]